MNENIILAGGLCLWRSEDGGYDWSQETAYWATSDGLHEYIHPDQHSLMYHPINNKLYVANDGEFMSATIMEMILNLCRPD